MSSKVVRGETIILTKGDTFDRELTLYTDDDEETVYHPTGGDSLRFAVKKHYCQREPLIRKDIPIDTMHVRLDPEDTKKLRAGSYVYDIQLTYEDGDVDTVIPEGDFILTEEVE